MSREELAYVILQFLKYDDDNETYEFWNKIKELTKENSEYKIATTINELIDTRLINGNRQSIGMKNDVDFVEGLNITLNGINYLKENSKMSKILKNIKNVKDILK